MSREIRDARRRAGHSQAELAERAGTSQATVSAYETGAKSPSAETLARLLAAAGSRLRVEAGASPLIIPSRERHRRTARSLIDVLALAGELPSQPTPGLAFPRLPTRA